MLSSIILKDNRLCGCTLSRRIWLALIAVHLPAFITSWNSSFTGSAGMDIHPNCLWLSGAIAFFILKALDLPQLRFANNNRNIAVITISLALMHLNVIGAHLGFEAIHAGLPLLAAIILATGISSVQSRIDRFIVSGMGIFKATVTPLLLSPTGKPAHPATWGLLSVLPVRVPRAPPAL